MLYQKISDIPLSLEGKVAIKLHMGERGNKMHISPHDVRVVFDNLKKSGCKPFLTDSVCLYPGARHTPEGYMKVARENGFGEFPIVIPKDDDYIEKDGFKFPREVFDADSLLVLSHGKGHGTTAFGGAIKNLGMGFANTESKNRIHGPMMPAYNKTLCKECLACEKACFCRIIRVKPEFRIDEKTCSGCGHCIEACPTGALHLKPHAIEDSFRLFCLAAKHVVESFEKVAYITVLKNITEFCDCLSNAGKIVCPDIGYLSGKTALEIDQEAVSLIRKKNPKALDFKTWELFEKEAKRIFG
jgi:uncharacterized Fe-S center protein